MEDEARVFTRLMKKVGEVRHDMMKIFGVETLNQGCGTSVNDAVKFGFGRDSQPSTAALSTAAR